MSVHFGFYTVSLHFGFNTVSLHFGFHTESISYFTFHFISVQAATYLHFLWIGPLQAIAVLTILWYELGPAVVAGFLVLLLLIPVQTTMGKLVTKFRLSRASLI